MRFEDLDVWKVAVQLAADIYSSTSTLKDRGFRDQITRAALSISSNIAEGSDRDTSKDLLLFLRYAKGSCGEVRSQLYVGINIGYFPEDFGKQCIATTNRISAMLHRLAVSIKKRTKVKQDRES